MKFINLTLFHLRRWGRVFMAFCLTLVLVNGLSLTLIDMGKEEEIIPNQSILVNESNFVEEEILPALKEQGSFQEVYDLATAKQALAKASVPVVYYIPADFLVDPSSQIQALSLNGQNRDPFFEQDLISQVLRTLKAQAYQDMGWSYQEPSVAPVTIHKQELVIDDYLFIMILLTSFLMAYSSGIFGTDLANSRESHLLKRSVVSNNSGLVLIGSQVVAYALTLTTSASLASFVICLLFDLPLGQLPLAFLLYLAMSFFTVALTLMVFRWVKRKEMVFMICLVIVIILFVLGLSFGPDQSVIRRLKYLSPFYWLTQALDTGIIWPNVTVIIMMAFVLLTAGSLKAERLADV